MDLKMTVFKIDLPIKEFNFEVDNLVIGHFNIIHKGHAKLFENLNNFSFLIFENNPSKNVTLYTLNERIENLAKYHPQHIFIFNILENNLTYQEFIDQILKKIKPQKIIVGNDFRFGKDQQGNVEILKKFFNVNAIEKYLNISTSHIYDLLNNGNIKQANALMDFDFYYSGVVVHGKQIASKLFFPTANVIDLKSAQIKSGSYVTTTIIDGIKYKSISFIGIPKSFEDNTKYIETYIFDFNQDIYGKKIYVNVLEFIRENQKFNNMDELVKNVNNDLAFAKNYHLQHK